MEYVLCDIFGRPVAVFTSASHAKYGAERLGWKEYSIFECERITSVTPLIHWEKVAPKSYEYKFPQP